MPLPDHVNDDAELLHYAIADALGQAPSETEQITLEVLDALGGRSCYLASGAKARKALAKEKARALLDQGLGPLAVRQRVASDDDVGNLSLGTIEELAQESSS